MGGIVFQLLTVPMLMLSVQVQHVRSLNVTSCVQRNDTSNLTTIVSCPVNNHPNFIQTTISRPHLPGHGCGSNKLDKCSGVVKNATERCVNSSTCTYTYDHNAAVTACQCLGQPCAVFLTIKYTCIKDSNVGVGQSTTPPVKAAVTYTTSVITTFTTQIRLVSSTPKETLPANTDPGSDSHIIDYNADSTNEYENWLSPGTASPTERSTISAVTIGVTSAVVVAVVLIIAIVIILAVIYLRRRQRTTERKNEHSVSNVYNNLPPPSSNGHQSTSVVAPTAPPLTENAYSVANEVTPSHIASLPWNTGASAGVDNYDFIGAKPLDGPQVASTAASSMSVPVAEPQYAEVNMMNDPAGIDVVVQSPPGGQMPEYAQVNKKKVNSGTGVASNKTTTAEEMPEYAQVNKFKRQENGTPAIINRDEISGEQACRPGNEPAYTKVDVIREGLVASGTTPSSRGAGEMDEVTLVDNMLYS